MPQWCHETRSSITSVHRRSTCATKSLLCWALAFGVALGVTLCREGILAQWLFQIFRDHTAVPTTPATGTIAPVAAETKKNVRGHTVVPITPATGTIAPTAKTRITPTVETKTMLVYVCNDLLDDVQVRKMKDLYSHFGENLVVVTDSNNENQNVPGVPSGQIVFGEKMQKVTSRHLFTSSHVCCGLERALMWLIHHQDRYDHAWMMEDDVYWTNFTQFRAFFESYKTDPSDFLHQNNEGMEGSDAINEDSEQVHWWNLDFLRPPHVKKEAQFRAPYYHGLFMFYRMSSKMAQRLDDWRLRNNGEWTFFEPLLSTLPMQDGSLTTKCYLDNAVGYDFHLNYRPCFEYDDIHGKNTLYPNGGVFHPVKKLYKACKA